jgi:ADP-ribose pyrophosphatase YjhB (NUDIX family)
LAAQASSPRIRVAAVIPHGDGILVVRHRKDGETYHLLPGGGVEPGETLAEALRREVLEETGLACELVAPLFINDSIASDGSRHVLQLTFLVRPTGGELGAASADPRVEAVEPIAFAQLADLDLRPPMAAALLEAAAAGYTGGARYLGPLWSGADHGITEADRPPETDE